MDKQYTKLLGEFYYVVYRLASSTLYDETDDDIGKKSERRRELFEQGLHILKFVITGIVAICVFVFFSRRNWGLQEMLPPLIFIPGMVYFLVLDQYLP